jgi:cytochrome c553
MRAPLAKKLGLTAVVAIALIAGAAPTGSMPVADSPVPGSWKPGDPVVPLPTNEAGAKVFSRVCAACHEHAAGHAPAVYILKIMTPDSIYGALTVGAMRVQAKELSDKDKKDVAEFLTGVPVGQPAKLSPPPCAGAAAQFDLTRPPAFSSWGITPTNTRYLDGAAAGLEASHLDKLRLKWALGFDGAVRVRSQPALAGGAIYVGTQEGRVDALDRASGCLRWQFQAAAEVRTGILPPPGPGRTKARNTSSISETSWAMSMRSMRSADARCGATIPIRIRARRSPRRRPCITADCTCPSPPSRKGWRVRSMIAARFAAR